jgi:putative nucleotidyltransferase with HDIG domain
MGAIEECINYINQADKSLLDHCIRTGELAAEIAKLSGENPNLLYRAGIIHDIGKICISNSILYKRGSLSSEERKTVDLHSYYGYCLAMSFGVETLISQIILLHHGVNKERYGLLQNPSKQILQQAEILQVADIYDALVSERSYHEAYPVNIAFEIMKSDCNISQLHVNQLIEIKKGSAKWGNH